MLDLEKLEVALNGFEKKGYEATVLMHARAIDLTLRKFCGVRGKWYGMTRVVTWIAAETASFDIIERTLENIEIELAREALLDSAPVPRYEDQVTHRAPVTGADVFKGWPQGEHRPGLASK